MIHDFLEHFTEEQIAEVWFQEDSTSRHTARASPVFRRSNHFKRPMDTMLAGCHRNIFFLHGASLLQ
jgi:hypothetical protein